MAYNNYFFLSRQKMMAKIQSGCCTIAGRRTAAPTCHGADTFVKFPKKGEGGGLGRHMLPSFCLFLLQSLSFFRRARCPVRSRRYNQHTHTLSRCRCCCFYCYCYHCKLHWHFVCCLWITWHFARLTPLSSSPLCSSVSPRVPRCLSLLLSPLFVARFFSSRSCRFVSEGSLKGCWLAAGTSLWPPDLLLPLPVRVRVCWRVFLCLCVSATAVTAVYFVVYSLPFRVFCLLIFRLLEAIFEVPVNFTGYRRRKSKFTLPIVAGSAEINPINRN